MKSIETVVDTVSSLNLCSILHKLNEQSVTTVMQEDEFLIGTDVGGLRSTLVA
jgi:hypothetical protein